MIGHQEAEKAFLEALVKLGIEPKTKDLQIFYGGAKRHAWDLDPATVSVWPYEAMYAEEVKAPKKSREPVEAEKPKEEK